MARQIGPPFIVGKLGGLQYYEMNGNYYVRIAQSASSGSKYRKQSDRSRENHEEFRELLTVGKSIRQSLGYYWRMMKNPQRNGKLIKQLNFVKKADRESSRGMRKIAIGLRSEEGKAFLRGIDLNSVSPLSHVLKRSSELRYSNTGIFLTNVHPSRDLHFPSGSKGVRITGLLLESDMELKQLKLTRSTSIDLHRDSTVSDLNLIFPSAGAAESITIILLSMIFLHADQSGNQVPQALPENVLSILDVV